MYSVGEYYDAINRFAPFHTAEEWDNVGLLIGGRSLPVGRALLALDLTGAVLEEARRQKASLVVTHHPVIFRPLSALEAGGIAYRAVAAGISVISAHTNLDLAAGGVNDALAARLRLKNIRLLGAGGGRPYAKIAVFVPLGHAQEVYEAMAGTGAGRLGRYSHCGFFARGEGRFLPLEGAKPAVGGVGAVETVEEARVEMLCAPDALPDVLAAMRKSHPYEEPAFDVYENRAVTESLGLGRLGELERPMSASEWAAAVKERLGAPGVRYVAGRGEIVTVAVCGGNGADLIGDAARLGAQALVTSEAKHSLLLEAGERGITLVDAGHFSTENPVLEPLRLKLNELLPGALISISQSCTDGVRFA